MNIKIMGGRKASQCRSALRLLGIELNREDPSTMIASGRNRHFGLVRSNPTEIDVNCTLEEAQERLNKIVAKYSKFRVSPPFPPLQVVEII